MFRTIPAFGRSCHTTFILCRPSIYLWPLESCVTVSTLNFIMNQQQRAVELLREAADALSSSAGPSPTSSSSHSTNADADGIQGPSSPSSCLQPVQGQGTHVSGASGSGIMGLSSHLRHIFAPYRSRTSHNFRPQAGRRAKPDQGGPQWGHKFCLLAKTSQVWRTTLL